MEIKLRAWDSETKTMMYNDKTAMHDVGYFDGVNASKIGLVNGLIKQLEGMLFIGLKDINGNEIFASDIIKKPNGDWGVIVYNAPFFEVTISENQSCMYSREWFNDVEVIGNIYENAELLKK